MLLVKTLAHENVREPKRDLIRRPVTVFLALLVIGLVTPSMTQGDPSRNPYALPRNSSPQAASSFDSRSGNSYTWYRDTTHANGFNSRDGTTRDSPIESNGNHRGRDSAGNYGTSTHRMAITAISRLEKLVSNQGQLSTATE
jgi:hypothetical protein